MTNRTLVYLTSLVVLGMIVLFGLNINSILTGIPKNQTYLKYNDVRGIAVNYRGKLYTLDFKQQNTFIDLINRSVKIIKSEFDSSQSQNPSIEQIVIYLFNQQNDIVLIPIGYREDDLIFSVPQWDNVNYFMELSEGKLHHLLSETYDH